MPTGSHVREKHAVNRQIIDTRVQCIQLQKELSAKIHYSLTQIYVFLQITSNTSYINIAFGTNRFRSRAPFVIKLPLITVLNEMVINVSIYSSLTIYTISMIEYWLVPKKSIIAIIYNMIMFNSFSIKFTRILCETLRNLFCCSYVFNKQQTTIWCQLIHKCLCL